MSNYMENSTTFSVNIDNNGKVQFIPNDIDMFDIFDIVQNDVTTDNEKEIALNNGKNVVEYDYIKRLDKNNWYILLVETENNIDILPIYFDGSNSELVKVTEDIYLYPFRNNIDIYKIVQHPNLTSNLLSYEEKKKIYLDYITQIKPLFKNKSLINLSFAHAWKYDLFD